MFHLALRSSMLLVLAAGLAPADDPTPVELGERYAVELAAGETRTFVVVADRAGPLTIDAESESGGVRVRSIDPKTDVLGRYRDEPAGQEACLVVAAAPDLEVPFELGNERDAAVEVVLTTSPRVRPLRRGDESERAGFLLHLGDVLEERAWSEAAMLALQFSAEVDYAARRVRRCGETYERVLALASEVGRADLVAIAHVRLGATRLTFDEPSAALEHLRPGLEQALALGHGPLELVARLCTGQALEQLGQLEPAREMLDAALELAGALGEVATENEVRRELGRVDWLAGRVAEADARFREATAGARSTNRPEVLAPALVFEAVFRQERAEFGRARALLEEALALDVPVALHAEALGELGNLEQASGNDLAALELFGEVLDLAREVGAEHLERDALISLGIAHFALGEWDRARGRLQEALALLDADSLPAQRATALRTLGDVDLATGRVAAAVPSIDEALSLAEEVAEPGLLAGVLASRVDCLVHLDRLDAALEPARRLSALGHERGLAQLEGVGLDLEAEVRLRQGDLAGARALSGRALPLLREAEDRWLLQWGLLTAVEAAIRAGEAERALDLVAEAERCFARTGLAQADPERIASRRATDVFALWGEHSQDATALRLAGAELDPARRAAVVAEGFRRAGFWKARSLLRGIAEHRRGARTQATIELRRELRDARAEEERLLAAIAEGLRERAEPRVAALRELLAETRARAAELERRWRAESPADAALDLPDGVAPERLTELLGPDEVLVEYAAGKRRLYAYSLAGGELAFHDLGERAALETELDAFLGGIASPARLAPPAEVARNGRRLFDALLAPVLAQASARGAVDRAVPARLVIVPTPALAALPFEALVEGAAARVTSFEDVTFVLDRRDVGYASSTSVLALLAELGPRARPGPALVVADPVYPDEAAARGAPAAAAAVSAARGTTQRSWPRLAGTRSEARAVASALHGGVEPEELAERFESERSFSVRDAAFELFVGAEATPELLARDLRRYAILHLASHGWVDPADPRRSGLVLAAAADDEGGGGGMLTLADILELDLDADLAVLSACETGRGTVQRGEGVQSLARAFLYAGARSVIASLWPVDDRETEAIMARFYSEYAGGSTALASLRTARLAVRHGAGRDEAFLGVGRGEPVVAGDPVARSYAAAAAAERVGHPFFWAPFVYTGRPR